MSYIDICPICGKKTKKHVVHPLSGASKEYIAKFDRGRKQHRCSEKFLRSRDASAQSEETPPEPAPSLSRRLKEGFAMMHGEFL